VWSWCVIAAISRKRASSDSWCAPEVAVWGAMEGSGDAATTGKRSSPVSMPSLGVDCIDEGNGGGGSTEHAAALTHQR
jgi:hypothetical protein